MLQPFRSPPGRAIGLLVILALALVALLPAPSGAAAETGGSRTDAALLPMAPAAQLTTVRFGSPQSISDAGIFIARVRGYFREQGLDVDVVPFQSGPDTIPAMASGDIEVAGGTL